MRAIDLMDYMEGGMEVNVRKMLIEEKIAKPEEVAIMSRLGICDKLLEHYKVVSYDSNDIVLVKFDDMETYKSIITILRN